MKLNKKDVSKAIVYWENIVGLNWVDSTENSISEYESATFKTENNVIAIIYPENNKEVKDCLKVANMFKIPVYPISKGKNWGYGSRVPASSNAVIISLERMNQISEYNDKMGYITVEPGVSFQQVYDFLQNEEADFLPPSIGSTPHASLIGNAVERGIGKGINGDRFQHSCNLEVVLPNGDIINTGFGHFENAKSKNVYRWGLGPSLDGIFTQSNFGIVTKMTFWLTKKPKHFQVIFYTLKNEKQLSETIEAIRELRLEGTLTSTATISNDYRVLAMRQQFPWGIGSDILPEDYIDEVRKNALRGGSWIGDDSIIAATKAQGKARARRVKEVLGKTVDKLIIIDKNIARIAKFFDKPINKFTGVSMKELTYYFYNSLYLGIPMDKQLNICYFRKKTPVPKFYDLDKDKCGVMWLSPSVPFDGDHITNVLNIMKPLYAKYKLEPNLGFNLMSDRNIACTAAIIYDREVEGQDDNAMSCYKEMNDTLVKEGYIPYRLGIQSMEDIYTNSEAYKKLLNTLKTSVDPNNILSPKHYGIEAYPLANNDETVGIKNKRNAETI